MIYLYQFPTVWGLPNPSPFCMKVETYLRLAKLNYEIKHVYNPSHSPKGKLPYIKDDHQVIPDSSFIIDFLQKKYGNHLDQDLNALEKAQAIAVQRLVEEHLYWIMVYWRWIDPLGWIKSKHDFFPSLPIYLRPFLPKLVRKKISTALYEQGIGRHKRNEIDESGKKDISALAVMVGSQDFFFGKKPTSIDATLYAFLVNILWCPIDSPLKTFTRTFPELTSYCERMTRYAYPHSSLAKV